jgi:hypothetical protein
LELAFYSNPASAFLGVFAAATAPVVWSDPKISPECLEFRQVLAFLPWVSESRYTPIMKEKLQDGVNLLISS